MSETGATTTTVPGPNYPGQSMEDKIKGIVGTPQPVATTEDVKSPGAPGGVTESGRAPKKVIDPATGQVTYTFYTPNDDANFLLTTMTPTKRDYVLKTLYERGQYGGSQRGNGIAAQDVSAMADLLYYANGLGVPWDQALVRYQRDFPVKSSLMPGSGRRAPIQVNNSKDIKAVFKKTAQNLLGRAVDDKIADSFVSMVQAQQRAQQEQYQTQSGGVVQQTADVATLAEQQIQSKFEVEQRVQNAANAAGIIDRLVKGLAR